MKKIILIFLGLFVVHNCYNQDYLPMLGDSNVWYILSMPEGYMTEIIQTVGVAIIEDKKYIITDYAGYLHEDTIEKKVNMLNTWWDKEILLYDFSLQKGDSILLQKIDNGGVIVDHSKYIIDSISPFQLIGIESRAIYLTGEPRNRGKIEHPVWIEGIGSLGNLIYPEFGPDIWNFGELACFYKNGELLYQSSLSKELGRCDVNTPYINSKYSSLINIFPNPFKESISIEGLPPEPFSIEIYDILGRIIHNVYLKSGDTQHRISTNKLQQGLYILRINSSRTGHTIFNKIIIKR